MTPSGRSGTITCTADGKRLVIYWEMSGVPERDILLAPVDLREWQFPARERILEDDQKDILIQLRAWLAAKRVRSDIDLPQVTAVSEQRCARFGCTSKAIVDSAYCLECLSLCVLQK